ncbi:hypothetical protein IQ251_05200, partial [Saccharopolyspora sp. HNM0983]|nr:hypothetical protein [Saccharopolyspora sp. HNM0983]
LLLVIAAVPVVALLTAGLLAELPVLTWAGTPVGLLIGVGLGWWWGALAERRLARRMPELLAEVRAS